MSGARIAIIGAGMAGLAAARRLQAAGLDVLVLERASVVGGRLAAQDFDARPVDMGALYATAREPAFKEFMQEAVFAGMATGWAPAGKTDGDPWLIGLPEMGSLAEFCGRGVDIRLDVTIERIGHATEGYILQSIEAGPVGPFDAVIVAISAPSAEPLLKAHGRPFERLGDVVILPTLAGLFAFHERLPINADFLGAEGDLAAAARHGSRAGRGGREIWIVHAGAAFAESHKGDEDAVIAQRLFSLLTSRAGRTLPALAASLVHRYEHARVDTIAGASCLADRRGRLVACGDWCIGARLEAAFISGRAAAGTVLATLRD